MSDILKFYYDEAVAGLSSIPWLARLQTGALNDFLHSAFPDRHDEDWKYTGLENFLQHQFAKVKTASPAVTPNLPLKPHFHIHNAEVIPRAHFPAGVHILPLKEALKSHAELIQPWLGRILEHEHGFHALNTASMQTGLLIHVPANIRLEAPIVIAHTRNAAQQAVYVRHLILMEEGSEAGVVEIFQGDENCAYFTSTVTEACLLGHARLEHYKIQDESKAGFHIGHLAVQQFARSDFESHVLSLGGALARSDLSILLQETGAHCLMNGLYLPVGKQHMDQYTTVQHAVVDCSSQQDYKGVLSGTARAVFNGKVVVSKDAQHTKAAQQNKNLLLSPRAEIYTKPQLDIFADDVVCSHGATVGQLDEDALFYLATRGIDKNTARSYLIEAFAAENLGLVSDSDIKQWMASLIRRQLEV